jgi:flagellar biosynthesis anti-sigma factor FlgM
MNPINLKQSAEADALRHKRVETSQPKDQQPAAPAQPAQGRADADAVRVSDRGAAVGRLVEEVNALPDVRTERVEALKRQIMAGEYNPGAAEIAAAILKDEI